MALEMVDEIKNVDVVTEEVPTHDALELTKGGKVATLSLIHI